MERTVNTGRATRTKPSGRCFCERTIGGGQWASGSEMAVWPTDRPPIAAWPNVVRPFFPCSARPEGTSRGRPCTSNTRRPRDSAMQFRLRGITRELPARLMNDAVFSNTRIVFNERRADIENCYRQNKRVHAPTSRLLDSICRIRFRQYCHCHKIQREIQK